MTEIPYKEILVLILGSLSTYLIWRVQHQKERLKIIESQLSDKKYMMYSQLIHILFDSTQNTKLGKELSHEEMVNKIFAIKEICIYTHQMIFLESLQNGYLIFQKIAKILLHILTNITN
ncbi:MAG: hypothetical protein K9I26_06785 [Flavobacterium sp.]|nr:hypothetical protein [Flavobacterium sp.]